MPDSKKRNRWIFILVIFFFLFFHQFDVVILGPLTAQIMATYNIGDVLVNPVITVGLISGIVFYLVWGYFYDRHSRKKLLSIAGFLWGVTSWLMGIAPTYATYVISNAAGGIDNASYSGIYALVGDYFRTKNRGKILGLFQLTQPLAYFFGTILVLTAGEIINWRLMLLVTGSFGFMMALIIFIFIQEPKRGASEPALADIEMTGIYLFDWEIARDVLKRPSMLLIYASGFFSVMPWFIFVDWMPTYLAEVNAVSVSMVNINLLTPLIALTLGYPIGGFFGDIIFRLRKNGRIFISLLGAFFPALFLFFALQTPDFRDQGFSIFIVAMAFFMAFTWPNIIASILDITLPEFRSTAIAIVLLLRAIGSLVGPWFVSIFQQQIGLGDAILFVCVGAWGISLLLQIGLLVYIPKELELLRRHMAYRSHLEARLEK